MSVSHENTDFRAFQAEFAARIRNPRSKPCPEGVPAQRMHVYEELLFNNLEGFLLGCFPLTREMLGADEWLETVRLFFAEHECASPLFRDIPHEFLIWLEPVAGHLFPDRPYLYEFMHYEWVELVVSVSPADSRVAADYRQRDLLAEKPLLNPTAILVCYRFPVHLIGPDMPTVEDDGQRYWYLVYRDTADAVRFTMLNPVSARLTEMIRDSEQTGREIIARIAGELGYQSDSMIDMGQSLLERLRHVGAVY